MKLRQSTSKFMYEDNNTTKNLLDFGGTRILDINLDIL